MAWTRSWIGCILGLSVVFLVSFSLGDDSSSEAHVKHMLSYLAGGKCAEVDISHLILDQGELMTQMTPKMEMLRKKVAFRLCQCYWSRVRPDIVVSDCPESVLESEVDQCVAKIRSEEGRMDYWQRFVEVNRFIFQLNAHRFSEAYKLEFADISQKYQRVYQTQLHSADLAVQEQALAQEIRNQSLQLESSLKTLSHQLGPLLNLTSRLARIGKSSWMLLQEAAEASDELKETLIFLALILGYTAFYIGIHLATASCFATLNVYGWIRTVLVATMLVDWLFPFTNSFRILFLVAGVIPISICLNMISAFVERRMEAAKAEMESRQLEKLENDGEYFFQWVSALMSTVTRNTPQSNLTTSCVPLPEGNAEPDPLLPIEDEGNSPPLPSNRKPSKAHFTSPKGSRKRG